MLLTKKRGVEHRANARSRPGARRGRPETTGIEPSPAPTDGRGAIAFARRLVGKLRPAMLGGLLLAALSIAAAAENRAALWGVVQACRINHDLTGAAFPCLEVNVSDGPQRGYVVLRPPVGPEDFILTPTRRSPGIEDPTLEAAEAPNYFEMAWNARSVLADGRRAPPRREEIALAVNSRLSRTQDQLHIHIGCLTRRAREAIDAMQPELSTSRWRRLRRPIADIPFWGRIVAQETLAGVNPFRLAMALPGASADRADMTIGVAATLIAADRPGFVILAAVNDRLHSSGASDLLASSCP